MQKQKAAYQLYLYLAALFITSLVVSNLIFQKFFYWYPFGEITVFGERIFEISVGILPYPVTFLITDLISEVFGKKKANQVVTAGIFASFFSLLIIYVSAAAPATDWSPIGDELFRTVFGRTVLAVLASMLAYLAAQYIDIHIYHFWKNYTKGRHLWLRNNFSTFFSQFIDMMTVLLLLCSFEIIPWERFTGLLIGGVLFKMLIALLDTPFLYFFVYLIRKRFHLEKGEEIQLP
ncbi:queuosine precursor transporter [Sinomicrobium weinanense]|uniref:Probable queuosine precursor transporter n=1 Tax=Sinomicrobium weinanense TaxID=2842200 RepID=A0A926JPC8_9FLAO|nr:queuosine precursor transporter [Sinomicrobium weinanense]MBC9795015.1 queuosine precursor transporter [Sinomicrobium weinanense]MBU3125124.1 queuosine precursor transporter [Sinomicrobium weinanense]